MRRVLFDLLAMLAMLAIVLAAIIYFRLPLLDLALRQGLSYAGFKQPQFRIAAVTFSRTEIDDIRLGPDLRLVQIRLEYHPGRLVRGQLDRISIDGLHLDLTGPRDGALGRLATLATNGEATPSSTFVLPPLELHGAAIRWPSPLGPVQVRLDGRISPQAARAIRGRFDVVAEAEAGRLRGHATIERTADGSFKAHYTVERGDLVFEHAELAGVMLDGDLAIDAGGRPTIATEANLASLKMDGQPVGTARASIGLEGTDLALSTAGVGLGVPFDLAMQGTLDLSASHFRLRRASFSATPSYQSPLLSLLRLPTFRNGNARFDLAGGGASLSIASLPSSTAELLALLRRSGLHGTATLSAEAWSLDGWFDDLSLVGGLDFDADGEGLAVRLAAPALIQARHLSTSALAKAGLPQALRALLAESLTLGLQPDGAQGPTLTLSGDTAAQAKFRGALRADLSAGERFAIGGTAKMLADVWPRWRLTSFEIADLSGDGRDLSLAGQTIEQIEVKTGMAGTGDAVTGAGTVAMTLDAPKFQSLGAKRLNLKLPLSYGLDSQRAIVHLTGPGSLRLTQGRVDDTMQLPPQLHLQLSARARPLLTAALSAEPRYLVDLTVGSAEPLDLLVRTTAGDVPVRLGPFTLGLAAVGSGRKPPSMTAALAASTLELAAQRLRAEGLTLDLKLDLGSSTGAAKYGARALSYLDPALPLPALSVAGSGSFKDDSAGFEFKLADPDGLLEITTTGRYALDTGQLNGKVVLPSTDLSTLLRTLQQFLPAAKPIKSLQGRIAGQADVTGSKEAIGGMAEIVLDDVGIDSDKVTLTGIAGSITLAQLWPPATATPQRLSIRAIQGPIPLRDVTMAVRLDAVDGQTVGRIHIDKADGTSDLAHLAIREGELDPTQGEYRLRLHVGELDLAALFRLANVEGLSGTGSLSGSIPLSYGASGLTIEPGSLIAAAPGVIRFTSEAARKALAGSGEQVRLMLQALENFQYQSLTIRLEKAAGGAGSAKLSIHGRNPDVLDGYPFALNIDLSGNFDSLLATVLEAYDLSGQALRATVK